MTHGFEQSPNQHEMEQAAKQAHASVREAFQARPEATARDVVGYLGWENVNGQAVDVYKQQPNYELGRISASKIKENAPDLMEHFELTDESYVEISFAPVCITEEEYSSGPRRIYRPSQAYFGLITPDTEAGTVRMDTFTLDVDTVNNQPTEWLRFTETAVHGTPKEGEFDVASSADLIMMHDLGVGSDEDLSPELNQTTSGYTAEEAANADFWGGQPDQMVTLQDIEGLNTIAKLL